MLKSFSLEISFFWNVPILLPLFKTVKLFPTGYVGLEEKSILIGVGCKHRDQAYVLSRYIIEEIKKRTPIWKKEHYENQDSEWLKGTTIETN